MKRSEFLRRLALLGVGVAGLDGFLQAAMALPDEDMPMPGLFVGHGSPNNILADNAYTRAMQGLGTALPRPKAILVVSAHWLSRGSYVSTTAKPSTIHDFFGFPDALYQVNYPAPGAPAAAKYTLEALAKATVQAEPGRGLDHGAWSVLKHMYPAADIPVFQLSIDRTKSLEHYLQLGRMLRPLRTKGILVIGSGNVVHNLALMKPEEDAPAEPWAEEFDVRVANLLERGDVKGLLHYHTWGKAAELAHPSNDHFLPLLYTAGLLMDGESTKFVHTGIVHGTIGMRAVQVG